MMTIDKYSYIHIKENLGVFIYFFIGTFILGLLGEKHPELGKPIATIIQEHLAGKSILTLIAPAMFFSFLCSIYRSFQKWEYGSIVKFLLIHPSNFLVTLCFAASAINWAITLSFTLITPQALSAVTMEDRITNIIMERRVLPVFTKEMFFDSLNITIITLLTTLALWLYHIKWSEFEVNNVTTRVTLQAFKALLFFSAIFWFFFWIVLLYSIMMDKLLAL